jgi:hypothetical protein
MFLAEDQYLAQDQLLLLEFPKMTLFCGPAEYEAEQQQEGDDAELDDQLHGYCTTTAVP